MFARKQPRSHRRAYAAKPLTGVFFFKRRLGFGGTAIFFMSDMNSAHADGRCLRPTCLLVGRATMVHGGTAERRGCFGGCRKTNACSARFFELQSNSYIHLPNLSCVAALVRSCCILHDPWVCEVLLHMHVLLSSRLKKTRTTQAAKNSQTT